MRNPLTIDEIHHHINQAYELAVAANQATHTTDLPHVKKNLDKILDIAENINLDNLPAITTRRLRRALTKGLTRRIRKIVLLYATGKKDFLSGFSANWYTDMFLYQNRLKKITFREQGSRARNQNKTIQTPKTQPRAITPTTTPQNATHLTFPTLDFQNKDLNQQLQTLKNNWQRATALPSQTSEDRFLLEQIALAYIPDSWAMHHDATLTPGTAAKRANTLIRDQFETLNSRILEILTHSSDNALSRLEAQTNFIKQKNPTTKTSILNIR